PLGRRAPADRGRMGTRRAPAAAGRALRRRRRAGAVPAIGRGRPGAAAAVRRCLGMDRQRLPGLPRLPPVAGRQRRVQRQVHERPVRAARRQLRHPARPRPRQLPQLLPPARALAVLGPAPGPRPGAQLSGALMPAAALAANPVPAGPTLREDVLAGLSARPRRLPSKYFYDARGSALFEAITRQPEYYLTRVE